VPDNEEVLIVLLPGMDGTGTPFKTFVGLLPNGIYAKIVPYPKDGHRSCAQLAELVIGVLPRSTPGWATRIPYAHTRQTHTTDCHFFRR